LALPGFRYHPDPLATGSVAASDRTCACCGGARGFIYTGPVYAVDELDQRLCPWCIHDGSAHRVLGAEFTDARWVGGYSSRIALPAGIVAEVAYRTPGFTGWQQEHWLACCGDAAAFLGLAGHRELEGRWPDAIESVRREAEMDDETWNVYFTTLDVHGEATAYVFRCLHCAKLLAYSDCR
jgi:uncharacterized protein CbrC (UPF0167 family)